MALKKNDAKEMAALEAKLDEELEAGGDAEDLKAKEEAEAKAKEEAEEAEAKAKEEAEEAEAKAKEEAEAKAAAETKAKEEAEAKAAAETKAKEKPEAEETLVKVENLSHSTLYQHSTGLTIAGKSTKSLRNDGWLKNQIAAKLLKRV